MTHPFHPWCGREFVFVALRQTWGEDRAFFLDGDATLKSLPVAWTDAAAPDVFVAMAAGRSPFRAEDLVALTELVADAREVGGEDHVQGRFCRCCKVDFAVTRMG